MPKQLYYLLAVMLLSSCERESKYPYAIKDFPKALRPLLTHIVSKGIVRFYDTTLDRLASDKELIQLGQSEHPVLRATAYRAMMHRPSFDHFTLLMHHLDDTAIVATYGGEWGIEYKAVSDDIISHAEWKTMADKNKTIEEVITKHNYLRSAYTILERIEPQEKYYSYIKDMATRGRRSVTNFVGMSMEDLEFALYGLAKYKKKEDVEVIKELLLAESWRMSSLGYKLLKEFPDPAYLEVFETFYPRRYYRAICRDRDAGKAVDFINSIAGYKNTRSARILDSILNKKPFVNCPADTNYIRSELIYAIWNNPCAAYEKLRKQVEEKVKTYEANKIELPVEEVTKDTAARKIRWLSVITSPTPHPMPATPVMPE